MSFQCICPFTNVHRTHNMQLFKMQNLRAYKRYLNSTVTFVSTGGFGLTLQVELGVTLQSEGLQYADLPGGTITVLSSVS